MAATVLVMFTLHGKKRNTNEWGVVVHTRNPSRLETGMSGTTSSRPVCVTSGSRLAWMYQDVVLQQNNRNRGKSGSVVVHTGNASACEAEAGRRGT